MAGIGPVVAPEVVTPSGSSAYSDFIDLRTAVIENVGRPDIADVFPRLLSLAEARFAREVRARDQIKTVTLTLAGNQVLLPEDWLETIGVVDAMGREYIQQSPQFVKGSDSGAYYSIEGGYLVGPLDSGDVEMVYYSAIPSLGEGVTATNWLLQRYPDLYESAVTFEAAKHVKDAEMAEVYRRLARESLRDLRADDSRARYSRVRVRLSGPTP